MTHDPSVAIFVRGLGQALVNAGLYGLSHRMTIERRTESYRLLLEALQTTERFNLSTADDNLLVEGQPFESRHPGLLRLGAHLKRLGVTGLTFTRGITEMEYGQLFDVLASTPISESPEKRGLEPVSSLPELEHVRVEQVRYVRVSSEGADLPCAEVTTEESRTALAQEAITQIVAFLKGEAATLPAETVPHLAKMASDSQRLAELILEATAIRQVSKTGSSGETLADVVIGCLRRTFEGLSTTPFLQSRRGRNTVRKALLLLEKTVLDRLRSFSPQDTEVLTEQVSEAIEKMVAELDFRQLAADYLRLKRTLEETEKKLSQYVAGKASEGDKRSGFRGPVAECAGSIESWDQLAVTSASDGETQSPVGKAATTLDIAADQGTFGALAVVLAEMDRLMSSGSPLSRIDPVAHQAEVCVRRASERAGVRMVTLRQALRDEHSALARVEARRREAVYRSCQTTRTVLAEIVQELAQAVTAIHCSLSLVLGRLSEGLSPAQRQVLDLAAECSGRVAALLARLHRIIGLPPSLTPDKLLAYGVENGEWPEKGVAVERKEPVESGGQEE